MLLAKIFQFCDLEPNMLEEELDILGQQPLSNRYIQICFCFPVADPLLHSVIISTLTDGLERLSSSFPWVAGQVVNEGSGEGKSGTFKIKSFGKIPQFLVKDVRHDPSIPTMDVLRKADFPCTMLDESVIAPRKTIPETSDGPTPVFVVQANFIIGGLLLTFVGQHQTMDMTGQGQIMRLFCKACRSEPFTKLEISSGNLERPNLINFFDESYEKGPELDLQVVKPTQFQSVTLPPSCTWTYFTFSSISLKTLKTLATENSSAPSGYISTDDALSAFIWQSITRVRLRRISPNAKSTFARAVDVRSHMHVPAMHTGLLHNMTFHTDQFQKLVKRPLSSIASCLRAAVDTKTSDLPFRTSALATFLDRTPDKSVVSFTATVDYSTDVMLSSWAKVDCYGLDFNLGLGKPESVRRPRFDPVESLVYLMPRTPDGDIALAICLRDEDLENLREDEEFVKYARHIG